jgi:uncharacterized protein YqgC (DUF456 family)
VTLAAVPALASSLWLAAVDLAGLSTLQLAGLLALAVGVVGSVVPLVPGGAASLAGVGLYWYGSGFTEPGPLVLVALVGVGVVTVAVDLVGGAIAARVGGASTTTTAAAALAGVVLLFVAGPVGLLAGVAGTVFVLELRRTGDREASARTAVSATVGVLASAAVQVVLTGAMLAAMLVVAFA